MINTKLELPCGEILKNRIVKSAMSENLAKSDHAPWSGFNKLYSQWVDAGLVITGNVMVDSSALGEPNNIVIEKGRENLETLSSWAKAGTQKNCHLWVQLNHPGKQSPKYLSKVPVAPSAIGYKSHLKNMFNTPRELSELEIWDIIGRFAYAAEMVKRSGFTGVQIHGAHGYLISQFLSPRHNQRSDKWGKDRSLFVIEIYKAMRKSVGEHFPIGIKLNSADFQKDGFSTEESMDVILKLSELGVDLIEVSGGSYEAPVMMKGKKESTLKREAYFLDYAKELKKHTQTPIVLTGGFRTQKGMIEALENHACDLIGLARSMAIDPDFAHKLLNDMNVDSPVKPLSTGFKTLDKIFPLEIIWYTDQLHRMAKGKRPNPNANVFKTCLCSLKSIGIQVLKPVRNSSE